MLESRQCYIWLAEISFQVFEIKRRRLLGCSKNVLSTGCLTALNEHHISCEYKELISAQKLVF